MFKRSPELETFIMGQESFSENAFEDFGRTSVGYGTQGTPGQKISKDQAFKDMQTHLNAIEGELGSMVTRMDLPQHRKDVLLDIAYNMGTPRMQKTGIIDLVNQGKDSEVAELISRLTKARDQQSGKLIELAGLKKRADLRRSMWDGTDATTGAVEQDDLLADFDTLQSQTDLTDDLLSDFDKVAQPAPSDRGGAFGLATDISLPEDADRQGKINKLSNEFGVPAGQVDALLTEYDESTVRMKLDEENIKKIAPKTAQFASDPANNAVVKKDPDLFKRTEFLTKYLGGEKSQITRALNTSFLRIDDGLLMMQVLNGQLSREEAVNRMKEVEGLYQSNNLDNETKRKLMVAGEEWGKAWDTLSESEVKRTIREKLSAIGNVLAAAGSYGLEMVKDPIGWTAFQLENGGAGLMAGAATGFVGRGAVEALSAFGGLVREKLEEFRDPDTGEIDYDAFLSDKEMLNTLNKEASTYAGTIGLISGAYQKVGGKLIAKNGMSGAASAAALGATSEGVGETGARTAGQVVSGQEVTLAENIQEGFVETLAGTPTAVASAGAQAIINRSGTVKTGKNISEAQKAQDATLGTSEIKAQLNENKLTEQFPGEIKEHLDTVTEAEIDPITEPLTDEDPSTSTIDKVVTNLREESEAGSVSFSPSEWIAFNEDRGVDPIEALNVFSPEIRQAFADNRSSDSSVVIPYSEWVLATREDPEVDVMARFNGNELNTLEANEVVDSIEKNPMVFFDTTENTPSIEEVVDQNLPPEWNFIEEGEGDAYRVDLKGPFTTIEEGEAYQNFRNRLARAMPKSDQGFIDDLALVELRRLRMRAEVTGLPLAEVMKRIQFEKGKQSQVTTPTFDKNFFSVVLGDNANPIAAIHELAHVWLHEMAEDFQLLKDVDQDTMTPDVRAYRDAMDAAVELLGLESLDDILLGDMARVTNAQEVFAQSAEKFFMDNHAENSRTKALMDRMRIWMLKYYDKIRNLAQRKYPTLQMTPQVKSMFESILAASNAAQDQVNHIFPAPLFNRSDLGVNKIAEAYMSDYELARSEAWAEVAGKSILRSERENQRTFDQEYNNLWNEVAEDVDSTPAMMFRAQMEDAYKEFKVKGGQDPRVSFESVRDTFFNGDEALASEFKKQVPFFMMTGKKKGGLPVSSYMMMLNVDNPTTLRDMLLEANNREALIQSGVDDRINEIKPKLKSKDEIALLAQEAVAKEGRFKLIKKEVQLFQERFPTAFRNLSADLINAAANLVSKDAAVLLRNDAKVVIGGAKSHKFNALTYMKDMNRLANKASKSFKARDLEQAISAKVLEAKKHYEFSEALKAEKKKATAISRIQRLFEIANDPSALINQYDRVGIETAVSIINQVNANQMPSPITFEAIQERITNLNPDQITQMNKALDAFINRGATGENVTLDGIIALGNFARTAIRVSSQAKTIYKDGKKVALHEAVAQDIENIREGNIVSYVKDSPEATALSKARVAKTKARAAMSGVFSSEEVYLDSNLGSKVVDAQRGEDLKVVQVSELKKRVQAKYDSIPLKAREKIISDRKLAMLGQKGAPSFEFTIPDTEKPLKFNNLDELESAMLHMGSESGARAITVGNLGLGEIYIPRVTQAFWQYVDQLIIDKKIPAQLLDVVQEKWNIMEELYPQMADELARTSGIEIGKVNGWKVNVGGRELQGRYFPKMRKRDNSQEDWLKILNGSTEFLDIRNLPNKDMGITKERTHETAAEFNAGAFEAYVEAATNVIHLREPLSALTKMILDPAMREVLDTRRPGMVDNILIPWMKRTMRNQRLDNQNDLGGTSSTIAYLRRNSGMVFFLGNVKTVLSQPLGLFPSAHEVGSMRIVRSALEFGTSPKAVWERTMQLSPAMRARAVADINLNIREEEGYRNERDVWGRLNKLSEKSTYTPIHIMQTATDVITWNAAFAKAMKTMPEGKAIAYADGMVKKTQGSSNVSELTNIQTHSELMRLFTAFSTVPLLNYEIMTDKLRRGQGTKTAQMIGTIQATMFVALLPAIVETVFLDEIMEFLGMKAEDEDEEEDQAMISLLRGTSISLQSLFMTPINHGAAALGLKMAISAGDKVAGTNYEDSVFTGRPTPPLIKKLEDGYKGAYAASQWAINSVPMTTRQEAQFWELLTLGTGMGIPFAGMSRYNLYKGNTMSDNERALQDMERRTALRNRGR